MFLDTSQIWKDNSFPCRVSVKIVAELTPETAVPVLDLCSQLEFFDHLKTSNWGILFKTAPRAIKSSDGEIILDAILGAIKQPIVRPVDYQKLARRIRKR